MCDSAAKNLSHNVTFNVFYLVCFLRRISRRLIGTARRRARASTTNALRHTPAICGR
ncbi:hypothetical protein LA76x_2685 [Lysobacter antibioticus]|uniref:Uncharacterized protein n=1 Tax=Lysobacter antibioticus TaxID=84531 RepID=A0A0S2FB82_LYSAN|nr:hypothetical protein LA76x_2685 [Lysobacter antibioticus]